MPESSGSLVSVGGVAVALGLALLRKADTVDLLDACRLLGKCFVLTLRLLMNCWPPDLSRLTLRTEDVWPGTVVRLSGD